MTLSTQPYKGARDFYPEDKRLQKYIFSVMRGVVEKYGYEEYDAPILESLDIYTAKSGAEIVNEQTYTFEDRGGRKIAIRPEMTPTVSRLVAGRRQELAYPLRWYSIPNLWRYERPQKGRLREHWQLNVDLFGVADTSAEDEMIKLADAIMKAYGASSEMYLFKLNSRKLINYLFSNYLGLDETKSTSLMQLVDHVHRIEPDKFSQLAQEIMGSNDLVEKLNGLMAIMTIDEIPDDVPAELTAGLRKLMERLSSAGISNIVFDISLMRGFAYYTDIVFEAFDTDAENNRAMFGGGRYDGLVGLFGVDPVPTVGFGMGDVTLKEFLQAHDLLPKLKSETEIYVALIGDVYDRAQEPIKYLRDKGLSLAVDISDNKIDKQIKNAVKKNISYLLFIGEAELGSNKFKLKKLDDSTERKLTLDEISDVVKKDN
jgi:histidyl-tRNA synthetase